MVIDPHSHPVHPAPARRLPVTAGAPRRGWTLLEAVLAITICTTLVGLVCGLLWSMLRSQGQSRDQIVRQGIHSRLAEAFRADVAAAKSCQPLDEQRPELGIVLAGPGESRVEYRAEDRRVARTASTGEKITGRESYQLGDAQQAKFNISNGDPMVISCILIEAAKDPQAPDAAVQRTTILATLGRDSRREHSGTIVIREPNATITLESSPGAADRRKGSSAFRWLYAGALRADRGKTARRR